jgi:hypothetical protein
VVRYPLTRVLVSLVVVTLVAVGGFAARDAGASGGQMYWTDEFTQKIQRANLDGTGVEDLVTGLFSRGIALDVAGGKNLGVARQSTGEWFIFGSTTGFPGAVLFGAPGLGDVPVIRSPAVRLMGSP